MVGEHHFELVPLPRGKNSMEERYKYSIDESIMIERDIPWDYLLALPVVDVIVLEEPNAEC